MTRPNRKQIVLGAVGVLVLAALAYGFLPEPVPVQTATVGRGPLQVVVEEEGETRVRDTYVVTSPVAAFLRRIELEVGDPVAAGQPVARLEPPRSAILDPRSRTEAASRVQAAQAAVAQAQEQVRAAEAAARRAAADRARYRRLAEAGAAPRQQAELAAAEAVQAAASLESARAGVAAARAELTAARAAASGTAGNAHLPVQDVLRAPAAGRVLAVHRRSEGLVNPGEPLLEIGDPDRLEVRVDVLSQDAVRIRPGTPVLLDQWGGDTPLRAAVRRVEPQGFTEVSSLGVEEQRTTVVAGLESPPSAWASVLGSGYRVLARFIVWQGRDVLQVPTSALFRSGDGWAVFVVEGGRAVRRSVEVGRQAGLAAQVVSGLRDGETVIVHPGNEIEEGARVRPTAE
jgi:HlyD family secretion protein